MSRNLALTICKFCDGEIVLSEKPRSINVGDMPMGMPSHLAVKLFDEFKGLQVAKAICGDCCAPYLAWIDGSQRKSDKYPKLIVLNGRFMAADLSHRSTFNDEPGTLDMPLKSRTKNVYPEDKQKRGSDPDVGEDRQSPPDQFRAMAKTLSEKLTEQEFSDLFELMDTDDDYLWDAISKIEVKRHPEEFTGDSKDPDVHDPDAEEEDELNKPKRK